MVRVMVGLAAWAAGTVIAVCVAWFGANVVVRNAGVGPGMPVINDVRAYTLTGGHVTLDVTRSSVQLPTAVPAVGYSVQTWSGTGWLRVNFSSGPQVSSLIASWYEHAPAITVAN